MKKIENLRKEIFREYDIRGVYPTDIDEEFAYTIGRSFGSYISLGNKRDCVIAHDNRLSSESLTKALINGILSTGVNVYYLGLATTPMFYYACISYNIEPGIMVTASHNPKEDNGFKITFDSRGNARGKMIKDFYAFTKKGEFNDGHGEFHTRSIKREYIKLFKNSLDIPKNKLKVVIDPGNGTTSIIAKELYKNFVKVIAINNKSDGSFPNHHPDPSVESNLEQLKNSVIKHKADLGIAFDGDGDRAGFVDNKGNFLPIDKFMIIIIRDIISKVDKKEFLYDVKCSNALKEEIIKLGGKPIEYRTGASYTKTATRDLNLPFGGEAAGHVYFRDKFVGIDSGLYIGLRLIEIMAKTKKNVNELLEGIEKYERKTIDKIEVSDEYKKKVIKKVKDYAYEKGYKVNITDGVKVIFDDSWILLRVSNTTPSINGVIEAKTKKRINELYKEFMDVLDLK